MVVNEQWHRAVKRPSISDGTVTYAVHRSFMITMYIYIYYRNRRLASLSAVIQQLNADRNLFNVSANIKFINERPNERRILEIDLEVVAKH